MTSSILQDHSQTFVGVLASLLLITIIWSHESNFVIGIIHERSNAIKEIWRNINDSIRPRSKKWKFLTPRADRMFQEIMKAYVEGSSGNDPMERRLPSRRHPDSQPAKIQLNESDRHKFELLDERIETGKEIFVTDYTRKIMPMIDAKIESIKNSKKIVVSAIYALMSCLVIFIIDETMAIFPGMCDYASTFLLLLLLLSSAFWLGMWGAFFIRHLPQGNIKEQHDVKSGFIATSSSITLIGGMTLIAMIGCGLCFLLYSCVWICRMIVFGAGMMLPAAYVGIRKMKCRDYRQENPYSFAINHFLDFCVLSAVWSGLLFLTLKCCPELSGVFFAYEDWTALLIYLELYLLTVGIICPIFIPYLNTYILQWYMTKKLKKTTKLIAKNPRWKTINKDIESLYHTVSR